MAQLDVPQRVNSSLVGEAERRLLIWIARRLPQWVTPDTLTATGVAGAVLVVLGYVTSSIDIGLLWLVNAGLVLHWFGDSLDGTVARVRNIERPRFGFYLDQTTDVVGNLLIAVGVGLSPWARLDTALLVLATYHMLSIELFVRTVVSHQFRIAVFGFGPTEMRLGIVAMNLGIMVFGAPVLDVLGAEITWCDILMVALFGALLVVFFLQWLSGVREFASEEANAKRESVARPLLASGQPPGRA